MRGLLLVALLAVIGCSKPPAPPVETAVEVTAKTLFADYQKDTTTADPKYRNALVRVTGRIQRLTTGAPQDGVHASLHIHFDTGPDEAPDGRWLKQSIVAVIPPANQGNFYFPDLNYTDEVTIVGRCQGREDDSGAVGGFRVTLTDARLVSHTPNKTELPKTK